MARMTRIQGLSEQQINDTILLAQQARAIVEGSFRLTDVEKFEKRIGLLRIERVEPAGDGAAERYELQMGDATSLELPAESFDAAFLCWVLEHVSDPMRVLSEVRRMLRPGSPVVVTETQNMSFFLDPYSPQTLAYWLAFNDHQLELGGDPFVGAKLGNMLQAVGYRDIEVEVKPIHLDNRFPGERAEFNCSIDLATLTARSFNAFDREEVSQEKATQVAIAAARLFNRKGLDGASLDEIGASLGATKGAVYHYFDDKTDLVVRCYRNAFELYERILHAADSLETSGLDRSRTVMQLNSEAQAGTEPPLILQAGLFSLPDAQRAHFVAWAQRLWKMSEELLQRGIADGSCRNCDHNTVAEITAGAFMWIPKWIDPPAASDAKQAAAAIADLFAHGIMVDKPC
ncbi:MAG: TetR family transcriptional regulator [Nitrospiraceae bacterium]|nr:TetR family transcriptional regulator [Nitrospiraceae bacterium]